MKDANVSQYTVVVPDRIPAFDVPQTERAQVRLENAE